MKRPRSYSLDTKTATVAFVKSTPDWAGIEEGVRERLSHPVMSQARTLSGGASVDAIHRWVFEDISPSAERERLSHRGAKPEFHEDIIKLALGYAIDLRLDLKAVDRAQIIDFVHGFCGIKPQPQRVSEWLSDHGFSSQMSIARSSRMTNLEVVNEAVEFLLELRARGLSPGQILVMDETGLWSNTVERRTYNFRNLYAAFTFLAFPHFRPPACGRALTSTYFLSLPCCSNNDFPIISTLLVETLWLSKLAIPTVTLWQRPSWLMGPSSPLSTSKAKPATPPKRVVAALSLAKRQ